MVKNNKIYLLGFMGTGKTAISELLAKSLGWKSLDTDCEIVSSYGSSINDIFKTKGEAYFRALETDMLRSISHRESPAVVACGGGIVLDKKNTDIMHNTGTAILLTAGPKTIYNRLCSDNTRPLLAGNITTEYIEKMLKQRKDYYDKSAKIKISTDNKSLEKITEEILTALEV